MLRLLLSRDVIEPVNHDHRPFAALLEALAGALEKLRDLAPSIGERFAPERHRPETGTGQRVRQIVEKVFSVPPSHALGIARYESEIAHDELLRRGEDRPLQQCRLPRSRRADEREVATRRPFERREKTIFGSGIALNKTIERKAVHVPRARSVAPLEFGQQLRARPPIPVRAVRHEPGEYRGDLLHLERDGTRQPIDIEERRVRTAVHLEAAEEAIERPLVVSAAGDESVDERTPARRAPFGERAAGVAHVLVDERCAVRARTVAERSSVVRDVVRDETNVHGAGLRLRECHPSIDQRTEKAVGAEQKRVDVERPRELGALVLVRDDAPRQAEHEVVKNPRRAVGEPDPLEISVHQFGMYRTGRRRVLTLVAALSSPFPLTRGRAWTICLTHVLWPTCGGEDPAEPDGRVRGGGRSARGFYRLVDVPSLEAGSSDSVDVAFGATATGLGVGISAAAG